MGVPNQALTLIHFNDVYNVESRQQEPVGGAARFCTAVKSFSHLQPLVLFSGDCFSPSMLSTYTKGEQMIDVLNECGVLCSVFGNHEFDFGLDVLSQWVARTKFPWLMSNVIDNETGRPLGDGKITHVIDWNNKRIGLIGLVEHEWLDTIATINIEEITFIDFVEAGRRLGSQLKQEGCDYVIALTHMRTPNDKKLAENVDEIDLILGGHDHVYEILQVNGRYVIKSGTDFRQFSKITLNFEGSGVVVTTEEVNVTSAFEEDPVVKEGLEKFISQIEGKMEEVLGNFSVELDGRFSSVRTRETNLGNWVCDVVLAATGADLVIINSGTLRSDMIHEPGAFTLGTLTSIVPMRDPLVVLEVTGQVLLDALENSVSAYPKLEGRFPQVAGVSFAFDPSKPPGSRVDPELVRIGDEYLQPTQTYALATKMYLHGGSDGYTMLKDAKAIMDEEECPELGLAIQNHFQAINMRLGKTNRHSKHRQSLVTLSRRHSLVKTLDGDLDGPTPLRRSSTIGEHGHTNHSSHSTHGMCHGPLHVHPDRRSPRSHLVRRASLEDLEQESCELCPRIEGRIVKLTEEKRQELLLERQRAEADFVIEEVEDESSPQGSIDRS
ncbi:trifunctional nucleotide phosphoesterase protein YfkN isoform X2 [Thrips palmi]|nr:trifunctional nucleotide phosphoesterase protein YfkN isoform X2 [Thrips palmi]XP_034243361.1 trifunctional nucleotide phosphoesterase protein YfkN isoform X2 [Thrips palmi]XP_034243362.1 trifunctional nucleotide phosphoesterase protein YfkN isoform X2 [Thrips palmi]